MEAVQDVAHGPLLRIEIGALLIGQANQHAANGRYARKHKVAIFDAKHVSDADYSADGAEHLESAHKAAVESIELWVTAYNVSNKADPATVGYVEKAH